MIKRRVELGLSLLLALSAAAAGESPAGRGALRQDFHRVGFRLTTVYDQSRVYHADPGFRGLPKDAETARAIRVYTWYPADDAGAKAPLLVRDYVRMAAEDFGLIPEGANPSDESLPLPVQLSKGLPPEKRAALLERTTAASAEAEALAGPFPLIIIGHGLYYESPLALSTLAESLAARGYVVATCPLLGTYSRLVQLTAADLETEVRDLEFVIARTRLLPFVDKDRMGLVGFDLGGMAGLLLTMRNPWVKAFAAMDSGILTPHFSGLPQSSPSYREDRFTIPWLMMSQDRFLAGKPGSEKTLFDRKESGDSYLLGFDTANHGGFSSYAAFGIDREVPGFWGPIRGNPPKLLETVNGSIAAFFDGYLKGDSAALEALRRDRKAPASPDGLVSVRFKPGRPAPHPEDEYINDIIVRGSGAALPGIRRDMAAGRVHIRESDINWLGLHFLYWWGREKEAVDVFRLMTELFPESKDAKDSLAEALKAAADREREADGFPKSFRKVEASKDKK